MSENSNAIETIEVHSLGQLLENASRVWKMETQYSQLWKYGHEGKTLPFTPDEQQALRELRRGMVCRIGNCVMNAQKLAIRALADEKVKYVEGLTTVVGVPINHAWIEYNGKVYDPTLSDEKWKMKPYPKRLEGKRERGEYWGVEVPKCLIIPHQLKSHMYTFLSDPWMGVDEEKQKEIWRAA